MKKAKLIFVILLFMLYSILFLDNILLRTNDLNDLNSPSIQHYQLSNGLKLHLLRVEKSDKIDMFGIIKVGSVFDPPEKVGLANILGKMLRTGGTKSISAEKIDEELDSIGTKISFMISLTFGQLRLSCHRDNFKKSLKILSELLTNPAFENDRLILAKKELIDFLEKEKEDIESLAFLEFQKLLYGEDSPYARTPNIESINKIEQRDLFEFYSQFIHPNNISLAIWGDFNYDEIISNFEEAFRNWKSLNTKPPHFPDVKVKRKGSINLIIRENAHQSKIRIGHIGIKMDRENPYNKEYIALLVLNQLLGGQPFTSRLQSRVRSELGLSYNVFSMYWTSCYYPGSFLVSASTRTDATIKTIQCILEELRRIREEPISKEEIEHIRNFLINSYVLRYDSLEKIIARLLFYEYEGLPHNYFQFIFKELPNIDANYVQKVAKKYIDIDSLCILVVGNSKDFDKPLSTLGNVNILDR